MQPRGTHDHTLRIFGDQGTLSTKDCWYYRSPVLIERPITIRRKTFTLPWKKRYPLASNGPRRFRYRGAQKMDFCRGVAELAASIRDSRPTLLSEEYCLHVNELVIAIDQARETGASYAVTTTFSAVDPATLVGSPAAAELTH